MRDGNLITGLRKWKNTGIALAITVILFALLFQCFDVLYYANDDVMIQDILSGRFSGQSSSMTVYFNQPLSFLLSGFYALQPSIPWFGFFQIACYGLCLTMVMAKLISGKEKWWNKVIRISGVITLFLMLLGRQMIMPTYTVTAAVVGATAIFCVAYCKEDRFPWKAFCSSFFVMKSEAMYVFSCSLFLQWQFATTFLHMKSRKRRKWFYRRALLLPAWFCLPLCNWLFTTVKTGKIILLITIFARSSMTTPGFLWMKMP